MNQWTLLTLLQWTTDYFIKQSLLTPRLDAELLLAHLLGCDRIKLYMQFDRLLTEAELKEFKKMIQRRVQGEPVSYIRGIKEFWSLPFKVGPGVLVPRPDTEVLVESVKCYVSLVKPQGNLEILDIGTGSGNIAIALAKEFPDAKVTAIDISEEALCYARENAKLNNVETRLEFIKLDFFTHNPSRTILYDIIVSNPPYISTSVLETLDPGIKNYEPRQALDGGISGLDFYEKIGQSARALLKSKGMLVVEIGEDQTLAVTEIFQREGFVDIEVVKDYAGLSRVVICKSE